jgi:hypothetical protein
LTIANETALSGRLANSVELSGEFGNGSTNKAKSPDHQ